MNKTILTAFFLGALAMRSSAVNYSLGENDIGATDGAALAIATVGSPGASLNLQGAGGAYTSSTPGGSSTLASRFTGTQIYGAAGGGFLAGLDLNNFTFGFDAYPTASTSFHIGMTVGSNNSADGAGGNLFLYHAGGTWNLHSNGQGNFDTGLAASLNTWQSVRYERVAGVGTVYVNGVASATTTLFPAGGAFKDALSVAGNRNNSGAGFEGGFIGRIDNAYLTVPEPSAAVLGGVAGLVLLRRRRN